MTSIHFPQNPLLPQRVESDEKPLQIGERSRAGESFICENCGKLILFHDLRWLHYPTLRKECNVYPVAKPSERPEHKFRGDETFFYCDDSPKAEQDDSKAWIYEGIPVLGGVCASRLVRAPLPEKPSQSDESSDEEQH